MFPIIHHLDDLLPHIQNKPEISVKKQPNGCTVVCYAISTPETFNDDYSRECRGITFDHEGKILARTLHKFFNVGEKEQTQVGNIDWSLMRRIMDKRDGSMIAAMVLDGKVVCKTKKSFDTIQATRANEFMKVNKNYEQFVKHCAEQNLTPTFEWTSPNDRIVLKYNHDELVLLHLRDNVTGEYKLDVEFYADHYLIPVVQDLTPLVFSPTEFLAKAQVEEQKEGWIIQFDNGNMVKLKTKWYIDLHHSVTFTRERDIAEMVVNESVDDFKAYLTGIGESLVKVEAIENRVLETIRKTKSYVDFYMNQNYTPDKKAFAINAKTEPLFGLIMQEYDGKEPRYKEHFIKYYLKDYTLETV